MVEAAVKAPNPKNFVERVICGAREKPGFAAKLARADNPGCEEHAWPILCGLGVDICRDWQKLPYSLIGAALARAKPEADGRSPFGASLASCFNGDQGGARLRRLLACDSLSEACLVLRPMLSLINSKAALPLCHADLLRGLLAFGPEHRRRIRLKWAKDFYNYGENNGKSA